MEKLLAGESDVMMGLKGREIVTRSLPEVIAKSRSPNLDFYEMARMLAR